MQQAETSDVMPLRKPGMQADFAAGKSPLQLLPVGTWPSQGRAGKMLMRASKMGRESYVRLSPMWPEKMHHVAAARVGPGPDVRPAGELPVLGRQTGGCGRSCVA
jgi:hypothetical protein